jgi:hypothetical protein
MSNKVVGILVCAGYGPILDKALVQNTKFLDHILVATKPDDLPTLEVCAKYNNVEPVLCDFTANEVQLKSQLVSHIRKGTPDASHRLKTLKSVYEGDPSGISVDRVRWNVPVVHAALGSAFNKAKGIRMCQELAWARYPDAFQLVMDADISLTDEAGSYIKCADLKGGVLYGVQERKDFPTQTNWDRRDCFQVYNESSHGWGFFQLYKFTPQDQVWYYDWVGADVSDAWFMWDMAGVRRDRFEILPISIDHIGYVGASKQYKQYRFDVEGDVLSKGKIDKIVYINLPHRTDRRERMDSMLSGIGIPYDRFEAEDISHMRLSDVANSGTVHADRLARMAPGYIEGNRRGSSVMGTLGCYDSMYRVLEAHRDFDGNLLVLEDDVVFDLQFIHELMCWIHMSGPGWGVLRKIWAGSRKYIRWCGVDWGVIRNGNSCSKFTSNQFKFKSKHKDTLWGGAHFTVYRSGYIPRVLDYLDRENIYGFDGILSTQQLDVVYYMRNWWQEILHDQFKVSDIQTERD